MKPGPLGGRGSGWGWAEKGWEEPLVLRLVLGFFGTQQCLQYILYGLHVEW